MRINKARIFVVFLGLACAFLILVSRLVYFANIDNSKHYEVQNTEYKKRFDLFDRNGQILVSNLVTYSLYAEPSIIRSPKKIAKDIKKFFPKIDEKSIYNKISNISHLGRVLLVRDLTPKEKYDINSLGHVGLFFHEDNKRFYPYKNVFSHVLGFVDREENGLTGLEKYIDNNYDKAVDKKNNKVVLSLDSNVQNIVYKELNSVVKKFSAKGAAALVMDINNSEIYSLVSLPDFNPYYPGEILTNKKFNNKVTYELYEMGSSFKTFTMALALEKEVVNLDDEFDVSEKIRVGKFTIKDFKKIEEDIDIKEIFVKSSNIGTAHIAKNFTKELQKSFYETLGFFSPVELELIEKSNSNAPRRWGKSKIITASYGYGVSVNAVHLAQAVAAILNGGNFMQATLIKGKNDNRLSKKVVSEETSEILRDFFEEAVLNGTGWRARSKHYRIGGKTGTANKVGKRGYDEDRLVSSFVSAFPINDPKFLVLVLVDEPKGIAETNGYATGGAVAAPVAKNIITKIAPILNIAANE